jgi:excinuclease ABC subunit B
MQELVIYPGSHYVTPEEVRVEAIETIRNELETRINYFEAEGKLVEKQRLSQRTKYDMEMIKEIGHCKGIENYSRHFSKRAPGEAPPTLIQYFPKDYLLFIDESHQTIPQVHAMYNGDRARKTALVEFGFRLPSAYDNRPLKFEEFYQTISQVVYVSATPAAFEVTESEGEIVHQIIRPTGLLDPLIEVRPIESQVDDCIHEIQGIVAKKGRVLVTTLTKKISEELSKYLNEVGVKAKYLHSDIETLERMQIITDLRSGVFDVLVGINLLREGLDIPEVSLVAILDADKEGFLRSETALIQTCGRAARNIEGRVILYADKMTKAIQKTIATTEERRAIQIAYNKEHGITPKTVPKKKIETLHSAFFGFDLSPDQPLPRKMPTLDPSQIKKEIKRLEKEMKLAAKQYQFEKAAELRDQLHAYQNIELLEDHPTP